MNIESMLGFQIVADVILCITIVFLLWLVAREIKRKPCGIDADSMSEFKKLLEESKNTTVYLSQTLDEGRKSLKEIGYSLDERERRLRSLLDESNMRFEKINQEDTNRERKYGKVMRLVKEGLNEKEIAQKLDLPEGEIHLIIGLDSKKNESL